MATTKNIPTDFNEEYLKEILSDEQFNEELRNVSLIPKTILETTIRYLKNYKYKLIYSSIMNDSDQWALHYRKGGLLVLDNLIKAFASFVREDTAPTMQKRMQEIQQNTIDELPPLT